ncbi:MAG TPA: DUF4124 domain-containing protein [Burkholderiales bacterium]|jgi:hypothetical protein|nr:DUF4124 domain-containing protein [Burkholderiales bacterium]
MRALACGILSVFFIALPAAAADVYRWVDEKGTVHYSNEAPPKGVKSSKVDIDAEPRAPVTEGAECYTVRCQGERLEERLARREQIEAREAAERAAATPRPPKGLDFRKYVNIHRGMSEGEFITIAGEPDLLLWDSGPVKTYTYFPTQGDPFTTTVVLRGGRVADIERVRKF